MLTKTDVPRVAKRIAVWFVCAIAVSLLFVFISESVRNSPGRIGRSIDPNPGVPARSFAGKMYTINLFGGFPVGRAEMSDNGLVAYKDTKARHFSGAGRTSGLAALLFNAKAEVESYIDEDTLLPFLFKESLSLPDSPLQQKEVLYDHERLVMESGGSKRQILPGTQDPFSVMYYLSRQVFEPGKEFDLNINTNQKNYRFFLKVADREVHSIGGREIGIWVVKGDIKRRDKSPRHTTQLTMWLLDNGEKTPLFVKVVASGLLITARLTGAE